MLKKLVEVLEKSQQDGKQPKLIRKPNRIRFLRPGANYQESNVEDGSRPG